jgi:hypothetical protein
VPHNNMPTQGDASPQRWLEEGEVLRTTAVNPTTGKREVVSTYRVPATLRLLEKDRCQNA